MTWLEVTDTAIKLGLGALIAGGFAFLTNRTTLERDSRQRYATRRRDLLEKVLQMVVEHDKTYRQQKAIFDYLVQVRNQPEVYQKYKMQFDTLREALRVKAEVFAEMSGILLMLGEPNAEGALEGYRELTVQWYKRSLPGISEAEASALEPLRIEIVRKRGEFMAKLATIYQHE